MNVEETIFRAYDIRGVVDTDLTPEAVELIGQAIGSEAIDRGQTTVAIGRDGRLSGPALSGALARGLCAAGCDVIDIGQVPTPVLYYAANTLDTTSGVMVTGSHNPPEYNGLKIVLAGETLSGDTIKGLYRRIQSGQLHKGSGKVTQHELVDDYMKRILSDIKPERSLRIVVDCGNGVAGDAAPALLRALGCEVDELFCEIDGNFPNHHPDPSKPENLKDMIARVKETGADLGMAFDGDGDRLGVVDAKGQVIWPDRLMMLFARDIIDRDPDGLIIYDVKCSRHLPAVIAAANGKSEMWKTGHSFIKARMKETGALLAGEMSGHIFFKERWYGFDDALYSAARLLEILARDSRTPQQVFDALPDSVNTPELSIMLKEGEPPVFMEKLQAAASFDAAEVSTIDGLRVDFEDGWGLVRASNTTPSLVLRFEADSEAALQRIQGDFRDLMSQADAGIQLPF